MKLLLSHFIGDVVACQVVICPRVGVSSGQNRKCITILSVQGLKLACRSIEIEYKTQALIKMGKYSAPLQK